MTIDTLHAKTNKELELFLQEQEANRHVNFIYKNICSFISKRKLQISLVVKKIGKSGSVFSLVNSKGKEVHRFILTSASLFTNRNTWVENDFPITMLPSAISESADVLNMKFHIFDRLETLKPCSQ